MKNILILKIPKNTIGLKLVSLKVICVNSTLAEYDVLTYVPCNI